MLFTIEQQDQKQKANKVFHVYVHVGYVSGLL
jgi:Zn finger protein HypA/HybF involved in hydrogenase expression